VGVGNAHKYFMLSQILIVKRLAVWRLEHNGESQCDSNREKILPIICAVIATQWRHIILSIPLFKAIACFQNIVLARKQLCCLRPII